MRKALGASGAICRVLQNVKVCGKKFQIAFETQHVAKNLPLVIYYELQIHKIRLFQQENQKSLEDYQVSNLSSVKTKKLGPRSFETKTSGAPTQSVLS